MDGGTLTYTIPATGVNEGVVNVSLYPNIGATPAGMSYAARYFLANGAQYAETWVVPAAGPVTIATVRVATVPAPTVTFDAATQLPGIVPVGNGGTGLGAIGAAELCLKVNSGGTALEYGGCATGSGITSLNGQVGTSQTFATGTAGTDFGISSAANVHTFNLPSSSAANRGLLTSADWTTFDAKQPVLSTSGAVANQFLTGFTAPNTFTRAQPAFTDLSGAATDAQIPDTITLANITQITNRAVSDTTGDLAAARVDDGGAAATQALFSGAGGAAAFRAIADGDIPVLIARDAELPTVFYHTIKDEDTPLTQRRLLNFTGAGVSCVDDAVDTTDCTIAGGGTTHDLLSATHADTTAGTVARGDLVVGQTATPTWQRLALGGANTYFGSDGTDAAWSTASGGGAPVGTGRTLSTSGAALSGGGDLSANRTLTLSASPDSASVVGTGRTLTGGAGIAALGDLSANRTIQTASGETDFLASGALTCGASTQGRAQVHTTPLQYCDNAATPTLQYAAYGDSSGNATAALTGDSATAFFSTGTVEAARLPNLENLKGTLTAAKGGTGANNTATTGRFLRGNGTNFATSSGAASGTGGCTNQFVRTLNDDAAPTCASVGSSDITDGEVASSDLATANKTITKTVSIFDPTTSDTNKVQFYWPAAVTLQRVACATDAGTVTIQFDGRAETTPNTAGTNSLTSSLVCDTDSQVTTIFSDSGIAIDVPHNLQITAASGTPSIVRIHVKAQIN